MAAVVDTLVEIRSVERLLASLSMAVGPASMASFLGGPMQEALQERAQERFAREGSDLDGGWSSWAPLKDATVAIRLASGFGAGPINRRTGEMERYITQSPGSVNVTSDGAMMTFPGQEATGELAEKVKTAQAGKQSPPTQARPVIGLATEDLEFALVGMGRWITTAMGGTP